MNNYSKFLTCLVVISLLIAIFTIPLMAAETKWGPRLNLEGKMGDDDKGFTGQAGVLFPLSYKQDINSLIYTDLRGMFNESDATEANFGLGVRKFVRERNIIVGGYVFRDWRHQYDNNWNQWTVGAELLTDKIDFRVNGYFPVEDKVLAQNLDDDQILVIGNNVLYEEAQLHTYYKTMNGYDIEVGKVFKGNLPLDLGVYLRMFKFSGDDLNNLEGKGVRINTTFDIWENSKMKVGFDWQDDNVRGSSLETTVGFSIPFGKGITTSDGISDNILTKKMLEPARRDIDIVVSETNPRREDIKDPAPVLDPASGQEVNNAWYVTADGEGDGSRENPTNLSELTDSGEGDEIIAGENDIIILLGDDGPINADDYSEQETYFPLLSGQKLLSPGGYALLASGNGRSVKFYPETNGIQATLTNDSGFNIVQLADNTTVSGVKFTDGLNAIYGGGVSGDLQVSNNNINTASGYGIYITGDEIENIAVNNNIIDGILNDGIRLDLSNTTEEMLIGALSEEPDSANDKILSVTVTGNAINQTGGAGLNLDLDSDNESTLLVSDNIIKNANMAIGIKSASFSPSEIMPDQAIDIRSFADGNNSVKIIDNQVTESDYGGGTTLYLNGGSTGEEPGLSVLVTDNQFMSSFSADLYSTAKSELLFSRNEVVESANNMIDTSGFSASRSSRSGIYIYSDADGETNVQIFDNEIMIDYGIYLDLNTGGINTSGYRELSNNNPDLNITVSGNNIQSAENHGLRMDLDSAGDSNLLVSGNEIKGNYDERIPVYTPSVGISSTGIYVDSFVSGENNIDIIENNLAYNYESNDVYRIGASGIEGGGVSVRTTGQGPADINISRNIIENSFYESIGVYAEQISDLSLNVTDNQVTNSNGNGIYLHTYDSSLEVNVTGNTVTAGEYGITVSGAVSSGDSILDILMRGNILNEGLGGIKLVSYSNVDYTSTINAVVNDNIFGNEIEKPGLKAGEVINITGNQAGLFEEASLE